MATQPIAISEDADAGASPPLVDVSRQAPWPGAARARAGMWLPLLFTLGLAACALFTSVRQHTALVWAVLGAAVALASWNMVLFVGAARRGRTLTWEFIPRRQHYLQACAQGTVLLYWGWYWRPVYDAAPLILAQLLFAFAFDMLLAWTRRDTYALGFGPFPVVFSINLFLWFRPEWFALQLLMIAVGFAAKELLRWQRDGRTVHIFNPSSFPLALFSVALLVAGASGVTRGQDIAVTQFYPPHMYLVLFLVGLPGQLLFGVTSMTLSAVATTYLFGLGYFLATGTYFFYDSYIPIAVFLGMHLLFTDPSTSPRTELGRIIFGVLYGSSSVALYAILTAAGLPTFYDKLLQVPLLNLCVRAIDRLTSAPLLRIFDPARLGPTFRARQRHLAYMTVWAVTFTVMSAVQGVGDDHPGQWLPFWERACDAGHPRACRYRDDLQVILCQAGAGWACNEAGRMVAAARDLSGGRLDPREAGTLFERGCRLRFVPACRNATRLNGGAAGFETAPPTPVDYVVLLRGSKGPITDRTPAALAARACRQGWPETCASADGATGDR